MISTFSNKYNLNESRNDFIIYVFFGILIWTTYFLRYKEFMPISDDYYMISEIRDSWTDLFIMLKNVFLSWGDEGRPLGKFFRVIITKSFYDNFGFHSLYIFNFLINLINAILFYKLMNKFGPSLFSILCTLIFILYPALASKILIITSQHLQISLFFFSISILMYITHKKFSAYIFCLISLMVYENFLVGIIFLPIFRLVYIGNYKNILKRNFIFEFILHNIIILGYFLFRILYSPGRIDKISNLTALEKLLRMFNASLVGFYVSLESFITRVGFVINESLFDANFFIIVIFILIIILLSLCYKDIIIKDKSNNQINNLLFLVIISLIIWLLSYVLYITPNRYPPIFKFGRISDVHFPTMFFASIVIGTFLYKLLIIFKNEQIKNFFLIVISLYISFLSGFQIIIQNRLVESAKLQKTIWSKIIINSLDADFNDVIIIENLDRINRYYYSKHSFANFAWTNPIILDLIYSKTKKIDSPITFSLKQFLKQSEIRNKELYYCKLPWMEKSNILKDNNVILLNINKDESIIRRNGTWTFKGKKIKLKSSSKKLYINITKGTLFDIFLKDYLPIIRDCSTMN